MVAAVGGVGDEHIVLGLPIVSDDLVEVLVVVLDFRKAQLGQEAGCAACAELHDGEAQGRSNPSTFYACCIPGVHATCCNLPRKKSQHYVLYRADDADVRAGTTARAI